MNLGGNIYLESQGEDDVFIGGAKIPVKDDAQSAATSQKVAGQTSPSTKITPRSDRLTGPITPQNAQGVLLPEACVFVAKYVEKSLIKVWY